MNIGNKKDKTCNKITKDLHKMEKVMKKLDFDFLQVDTICVDVENESLELYLLYLKGD